MAITDGTQFHDQPVGAGFTGITKWFFIQLAAGVAKNINFGKYKLADVEHVHMVWGVGVNGNGTPVTFQGAPDTTLDIAADGKTLACEDAAGGAFCVAVSGDWTYNN